MSLYGQSQNAQTLSEVVFPDRRIPVSWAALEFLRAPDVVHQHVQVPVLASHAIGQGAHLLGVEMVHGHRDPQATTLRDKLSGFFDGFRAIVLRAAPTGAPTGADDRRARFSECLGNSTPGATRGAGHQRHSTAQRRHRLYG